MTHEEIPTLLLTGTVGSGKTAVADEISVLLEEAGVRHAVIDVDRVCQLYPPPPDDVHNVALATANLRAMWANYSARGATHLILARVTEAPGALDAYRSAIPGAAITTVRVVADAPTIAERLRHRESGSMFNALLRRSHELTAVLDSAALEDFSVVNSGRPLREVALEVLNRLDWPRPTQP